VYQTPLIGFVNPAVPLLRTVFFVPLAQLRLTVPLSY
jgi:hypothetical protein